MTLTRTQLSTSDGADTRPLLLIVGGDGLALEVCRELSAIATHQVILLWHDGSPIAREVSKAGARFVAGRPATTEGLLAAGIVDAESVIALSDDDSLNLRVALVARDINPNIRIVLRQFNRTLRHKVESNLHNCSVLSLASHSAGTYAAAALDPTCFYAIQFPDNGGALTGFADRSAAGFEITGRSIAEAERQAGIRILSVNGRLSDDLSLVLEADDAIVAYGPVTRLAEANDTALTVRFHERLVDMLRARPARETTVALPRINPILLRVLGLAITVWVSAGLYFQTVFNSDFITAAYFVTTTMTTVGYGDIVPLGRGELPEVMAMLLMVSGLVFSGIFIAFASAALTRMQWVRMQGLRRIERRHHIVICGAGNVGAGVIEYLRSLGHKPVIVEAKPDTTLVEQAREGHFDLLTGDGMRDSTLDLCNLEQARALIVLTNDDALNLETALGARARNPNLPVVLRIADAEFARSIARHFGFRTTFSTATLAAPVFIGLAHAPGRRGLITVGGREWMIVEWSPEDDATPVLDGAVPLAVWQNGALRLIHDPADLYLEEIGRDDALLVMIPAEMDEYHRSRGR